MSVASADNDNANANSDQITFNIKDTKLYVPVVTLPEKLSKLLSKGFERSVYWNEYKKYQGPKVICSSCNFIIKNIKTS